MNETSTKQHVTSYMDSLVWTVVSAGYRALLFQLIVLCICV